MQLGQEEVALASKEEELLAELLDESSSFAQEMTVRLKRNIKQMMRICLTSFPISGLWGPLYLPKFAVIHKKSGFYWEVLRLFNEET